MYISGFVAFTFFVLLFWRERGRPRRHVGARGRRSAGRRGYGRWTSFALVFTLLFTVFLTNPAGLWDGLYDFDRVLARPARRRARRREALTSTSSCCSRPSGRCCCWAAFGTVLAFRGSRPVLRAFLVWAFALSLAIYSWAGEKFSWLVLHPLLPLILLAGLGRAVAVGEPGGRRSARPGSAVAAVVRAVRAVRVVPGQRRAPRGPTRVPRLHPVVRGRQEDNRRRRWLASGEERTRTCRSPWTPADGATFPYAWYFRDQKRRLPRLHSRSTRHRTPT